VSLSGHPGVIRKHVPRYRWRYVSLRTFLTPDNHIALNSAPGAGMMVGLSRGTYTHKGVVGGKRLWILILNSSKTQMIFLWIGPSDSLQIAKISDLKRSDE
jgi:hypothetical protein